jgi:NADH-quinone oxidoreductase subunit M
MNLFALPWLELSLAVPLVGAGCVRLFRDPRPASHWCLGFTGATLGCALLSVAGFYAELTPAGRPAFAVDDLNAPLLPFVALIHFLTALTTAHTKSGRFSFAGLLLGCAVRLAAFACVAPWPLVGLLALEALLPVVAIGRGGRLYAVHAVLFAGLLAGGWACADGGATEAGSVLVLLAGLVRTGAIPAQVWVTDRFENGSFGAALLLVVPLAGVYAVVRFVLPVAPEWTLEALGVAAAGTAFYAAGRGIVERDARRFFAYLIVSHAALVLVGVGLHTPFAVTGALVMSISTGLSLGGLGLILRSLEARVGHLDLKEYRGLYDQSPALAVCFLLTGLAAVGFPGTTGFVAIELLVDEAVGAHEAFGLAVVLVAALNGIGVVRAYLLLFTGRRHSTGVDLGITPQERVAMLTLVGLILGGGLVPQAYLESRHRAAEAILEQRPKPSPGDRHAAHLSDQNS